MSFQNKSFWMPRDAGCLTDGDTGYDGQSKLEPKRTHHWFTDAAEQEPFSNKKQALDAVNNTPMPGFSHVNFSLWDDSSSFRSVSGQLSGRLFSAESTRAFSVTGDNISSVGTQNIATGRKDSENPFVNNSSVDLSMSHVMEDPLCLNHDTRKVKLNQVRDSDNVMSLPMNLSQIRGDENSIPMNIAYGKTNNNGLLLKPTYSDGVESSVSICPALNKVDGNFISMNHNISKEDGSFMLMGHNYSRQDDSILSIGQPFEKGDVNFMSMDQRFEKGDATIVSMGPSFRGLDNLISIGQPYNKDTESIMGPSFNKHDNITISVGPTFDKGISCAVSMGATYAKEDSGILLRDQDYNTGKDNTISFGGFQVDSEVSDPSGNLISSYDLLMSQNLVQASKGPVCEEDEDHANSIAFVASPTSRTDAAPKNKEQKGPKKVPPNNFPSNVKSLLSTGILDGVPVKYVSWSREKNIKGVIKGTGYLCGCSDCNHVKALNAYEFERHAGCKTKHPNNHIYFENGKTIYAVVQELKSTPQEMLFDTIQTVTGSPINQKNFRIWKASYQAATRELQRIYGKDEVVMPS